MEFELPNYKKIVIGNKIAGGGEEKKKKKKKRLTSILNTPKRVDVPQKQLTN